MSKISTLLFYIIIDIFAVFFMWLACQSKPQKKQNRIFKTNIHRKLAITHSGFYVLISFLILFLLLALRNFVGTDYARYVELYDQIGNNNLAPIEQKWLLTSIGYWIGCKLLYYFTNNTFIMFAVIAYFTLKYFYKSIVLISSDWALSLYLLICFCLYYQCFNQIRQMLSIAIAAYSCKYLIKDDLKGFLFTIMIACLFHLSSAIFLPVWIVKKYPVNTLFVIFYFISGIFIFFFFDYIIQLFSNTLYVSVYAGSEEFAKELSLTTILNFFVRLTLFLFCLYFSRKTIHRSPHLQIFYHIVAICTVLQVAAIRFNIFGRLTTYFYVGYIFLLPEVFQTLNLYFRKSSRIPLKIAVIAFFALYHFVYYFSSSGASGSGYLYYSFIPF